MKIEAYLHTKERGCKPSEHFKDQWLKNEALHPKLKNIPVAISENITALPVIKLFNKFGIKVLEIKGNTVLRLDLLENFIMNYED